MRIGIAVLSLAWLAPVVACDPPPVETVEACVELGGRVAANPGAGVECAEDEVDLGYIEHALAIEPPRCCVPRGLPR
jgi:hypothetical protein